MTQQDKDLLLRDLSARLPYKTLISFKKDNDIYRLSDIDLNFKTINKIHIIDDNYLPKPYLRPLSRLTQEEKDKFCDIGGVISYRPTDGKQYIVAFVPEALDYLNSIHADYRGMIEKGLAIEVTDENNPYK